MAALCVVIGLIFFESLIPFSVFSLPPGPVGRCWVPGRRLCARRAVLAQGLAPEGDPSRSCLLLNFRGAAWWAGGWRQMEEP